MKVIDKTNKEQGYINPHLPGKKPALNVSQGTLTINIDKKTKKNRKLRLMRKNLNSTWERRCVNEYGYSRDQFERYGECCGRISPTNKSRQELINEYSGIFTNRSR